MKWFDVFCGFLVAAVVAPLFSLKTRAIYWRTLEALEEGTGRFFYSMRPYWSLIFFLIWVAMVAVQVIFGVVPSEDPMGGH